MNSTTYIIIAVGLSLTFAALMYRTAERNGGDNVLYAWTGLVLGPIALLLLILHAPARWRPHQRNGHAA